MYTCIWYDCHEQYEDQVQVYEHLLHAHFTPDTKVCLCKPRKATINGPAVCERAVRSRSNFAEHVISHFEKSVLPYECSVCGRGFRMKRQRTKHLCINGEMVPEAHQKQQQQQERQRRRVVALLDENNPNIDDQGLTQPQQVSIYPTPNPSSSPPLPFSEYHHHAAHGIDEHGYPTTTSMEQMVVSTHQKFHQRIVLQTDEYGNVTPDTSSLPSYFDPMLCTLPPLFMETGDMVHQQQHDPHAECSQEDVTGCGRDEETKEEDNEHENENSQQQLVEECLDDGNNSNEEDAHNKLDINTTAVNSTTSSTANSTNAVATPTSVATPIDETTTVIPNDYDENEKLHASNIASAVYNAVEAEDDSNAKVVPGLAVVESV